MRKSIMMIKTRVVEQKIIGIILVVIAAEVHAQKGCITLESRPSRAAVYVDNEHIGTTPLLKYYLEPGCHTIRFINKTDNVQKLETVEIIGDTCISLSVELEKERGTLQITSIPEGAQVTIIRQLGKTALNDPEINPGGYTLLLSSPSNMYKDSICAIEVKKNDICKLDVQLDKDMKYVTKTGCTIGLCLLSLGTYIWGFHSSENDYELGAYIGFGLGTVSLLSLTILSFF